MAVDEKPQKQIHRSARNQAALSRVGRDRQTRSPVSAWLDQLCIQLVNRRGIFSRPFSHRRAGPARPRRLRQTANRLSPARFCRRHSPAHQKPGAAQTRLCRPFLGRQHRHGPGLRSRRISFRGPSLRIPSLAHAPRFHDRACRERWHGGINRKRRSALKRGRKACQNPTKTWKFIATITFQPTRSPACLPTTEIGFLPLKII